MTEADGPEPRDTLARRALAVAAAWTAAVALILLVDHLGPRAEVVADGWLDRPVFRDHGPFHPDGYRLARAMSELRLVGLWPDRPVDVSVELASALPKAQAFEIVANGVRVERSDVGGQYGIVRFAARTDAAGTLAVRLVAPRAGDAYALRVTWVHVERGGRGPWPWRRGPLYAAVLLVPIVGGLWLGWRTRTIVVALGLATLAAGLSIVWARVLVGLWLPRATACAAAGLVLAAIAAPALRAPRPAMAWWGAAVAFRVFLLPLPDLASIDLTFHAHNIERFQRGEVLGSAVSDAAGRAIFIPYPPALYAALSPFVPVGDTARGESVVRWTMIVLEATVPLLVLLIMRASGASDMAAAMAAVAMAVMPEGLLMVPKGVAANVAGSWLALLAVWAVMARASPIVVGGAMALAYLGHPGSAAALAALVVAWALIAARTGIEPARRAASVVAAAAAGALLAWALYYREVASLTRESLGHWRGEAERTAAAFFQVRWVHLGKMAQDVAFKFGLGPFVLAVAGLASAMPERLRALLRAWVLTTAAMALLAVLTPVALRFEYFAAPALAMAAGLGAERVERAGGTRWLRVAWSVALALQVGLGLWLHSGRFDPINVIIPSPRWPLVR